MSDSPPATIVLSVVSNDPFVGNDLATDLIGFLRQQDVTVTPAPAATMGGMDVLIELGQEILANKDLYIALAGIATPMVTYLLNRPKPSPSAPSPTVIVITKDTEVLLTTDQKHNEALLRKLLLDADTTIEVRVPDTD